MDESSVSSMALVQSRLHMRSRRQEMAADGAYMWCSRAEQHTG